jgi:glycosyltransferase involved in cell wall biosynthesis
VWVIPYVGHEYPLDMPSVVFVHDLVVYHFPELFPPHFVKRLMEVAPQRAAEATICACMSDFIKDTDLLGVLGLPREKVRMIHSAAPRDFPSLPELQAQRLKPPQLQRPYLFYPASLFMHKNHRLILEALRVLRDTHGEERFDFVCTGAHKNELPRELELLAVKLGVRQRVHVLGRVDRETLAALYIEAFATIVPSLYEQGSFPVYEAIYLGSPVACSKIPSLVEQCQAMGDAMLYFDPRDPADLAKTILKIRDERETIQQRQRFAGQRLWERTWTDVAREWLVVFQEAARLGKQPASATVNSESAELQAA